VTPEKVKHEPEEPRGLCPLELPGSQCEDQDLTAGGDDTELGPGRTELVERSEVFVGVKDLGDCSDENRDGSCSSIGL
jgi:hypothetical protein